MPVVSGVDKGRLAELLTEDAGTVALTVPSVDIRVLNDEGERLPPRVAGPVAKQKVVLDWDRSPKWSQFRSTWRQRGGWMHGLRHGRRVRPRRSARCQRRGVKSNQEFGVTELGTDGPARRSRLLSPAWWTGPPPIPRRGPPRATNRMTRPPRRSPPQEAARGFWIRAWGQREPALQGTGRSNDPARSPGLLEGGLDDPRHSRQSQLTSHRTPDPNVDVPRSGHSSIES